MKNKIKTVALAVILMILAVCLLSCNNTLGVKRDCGSSAIFTQNEINAAMDTAESQFRSSFYGCKMLNIRYDESNLAASTADYPQGSAIVLLSDFKVNAKGGDGSFEPNETVTDWSWFLVRNDKNDKWQVTNWGY